MLNKTLHIFYDGDCGLCQRGMLFLKREAAAPENLTFCDITLPETQALMAKHGISAERARATMHVLKPESNTLYVRHEAVAQLLKACRFPWPVVGTVMTLPLIGQVAGRFYDGVAARRHGFLPPLPSSQLCALKPDADDEGGNACSF